MKFNDNPSGLEMGWMICQFMISISRIKEGDQDFFYLGSYWLEKKKGGGGEN